MIPWIIACQAPLSMGFHRQEHWRKPILIIISSVQFRCSVVSNSLRPHESQHARPPCPSPTPRVYSNSCPFSQWCHPTISSSVVPFSSCPQSFPTSGSFINESVLHIRWPKYWSFSFNISPSNEHSGLISFRTDCLDPFESKGLSTVFSNTTVQKKRFSEWNILPQKSLPGSQAVQLSAHTFPWHSGMWRQVGLRKLHYEQS